MEIKEGSYRIALIDTESVYKLPKPKFSDPDWKKWDLNDMLKNSTQDESCYSRRGGRENNREYAISQRFPHIIVLVRSRMGLINVQDTAGGISISPKELSDIFYHFLDTNITKIGHELDNPSNFGIHEGKAKLVDGGGALLEDLLLSHYTAVFEALAAVKELHNQKKCLSQA